jgi:hypothetical protein
MGLAQFVPQFFQTNRRTLLPAGVEKRHHFAEDTDAMTFVTRSVYHVSNNFRKFTAIRPPLDEELRQHLSGIIGEVSLLLEDSIEIDAGCLQSYAKLDEMGFGGHNQTAVPFVKACTEKFTDCIEQKALVLIKQHHMI